MEQKKSTAVELLRREIESNFLQLTEGFLTIQEFIDEFDSTIKQAKQMEKEQLINAHITGLVYPLEIEASKQAEQYYNETYNN